ncbi:hypothetical protein LEP1GSC041_1739 [Leptospira noguchii str. 2006001870]|nr:hypothetical protein [Leptospira noguchii]EKR74664.1 hypothetical protein LEP1GSC041_1739 [Leptospira noguchii str. 2006001870]
MSVFNLDKMAPPSGLEKRGLMQAFTTRPKRILYDHSLEIFNKLQ